jgi:hypothetical protein
MANEMLARAADRGDTNQSPSSIASRMYRFYLSQGLPPDAALEQVSRLMSSGMYADVAERRTGVQDRAMELARRAEEQARMRANPQMLREGIAAPAPADLPGYDPTVGQMTGAAEAPRFSQPMTRAEADELRALRPMVQDTRPSWLRDPAQRRIPMSKAALEASPDGFTGSDLPSVSGTAQTYAPAAQGQPILNAGQEPSRGPLSAFLPTASAPNAGGLGMVSRAQAAPAMPMYGSTDMSAGFLDGPAADPNTVGFGQDAFGPFMPPERAARNAVRVAQSVMPQAPAPSPRPATPAPAPERAAGPSSLELWKRYNETESPADFVRADRASRAEGGGIPEGMMGARPMPMPSLDLPAMGGPAPMGDMPPLGAMGPSGKPAAGAGAGGRDAAINKALEIIHHLVIRGQ